ncbi:MAG: metallophosphoesterase family protein [Betaproteobacteria bacterium]
MKIRLLSDLHLEHSHRHPPFEPTPVDADVVVLAGDIDNGTRAIDWAETTFPGRPVLYVPGNHEYYDADMQSAAAALRDRVQGSLNVRLLDNAELVLDGVRFLGSTLWTDFELFQRDEMANAMTQSLRHVVDFRAIRVGDACLTPQQTVGFHRQAIAFLETRLAQPFDGKTVVVTHHAPHPGSVHPRWEGNRVNAAFVSDLTRLMGKSTLWLHGHTHDSFDYVVRGTRVLANPMGYRTSGGPGTSVVTENARFDSGLVVEI